MYNELPIPPTARDDKKSQELVRAWTANGGLHCSLNVDCWGDSEGTVWGILLSDVARHVADALHGAKGWDKSETMEEIRRVFNAELSAPTADPKGHFQGH